MAGLNPVEKDCQTILVVLSEFMSPGPKRHLTIETHTELCARVRDVLTKLQNKEYGCEFGKHSGPCTCTKSSKGYGAWEKRPKENKKPPEGNPDFFH